MNTTTTITQGENFLLNLILQNDDETQILVADLQQFVINAKSEGKLLKSWQWLPDNFGDPHIVIIDGLAQLEVESSVTKTWIRRIEFEVVPSFLDDNYFVEGAQTDVVCFTDLLIVVKC